MVKKIKEDESLFFYGDTDKGKYNLILFVGREANNPNHKVVNKVGSYDFDVHPECQFWNVAYSVFAESVYDFSGKQFKKVASDLKHSPILISDLLPISIENKVKPKDKRRKDNVTELKIKNHIKYITRTDIFKRVKVIVLCGLEGDVFKYGVEEYKKIAKRRKIKLIETKFLSSYAKTKKEREQGMKREETIIKDLEKAKLKKYWNKLNN